MRYLFVSVLILCCSFAQADELQDTYEQYKALNEQGKYRKALPFAEKAVHLAEVTFGRDDVETAGVADVTTTTDFRSVSPPVSPA